jgi:hypothetical protein
VRELSSAFLCLVGLLVSGCSLRVTDAASVNRSLTYVSWSTEQECKQQSAAVTPAAIAVRPGMRLVFRSSALGPQKGNTLTPRLNEFEWIVPRDRFVPADYLVIGHLLAASTRQGNVDDVQLLKDIGAAVHGPKFYEQINETLYKPLIASMTWRPTTRRPGSPFCPTPASLRQAVAEPTEQDFNDPLGGKPQLQFTVDTTTFEFGGGNAAYFNQDLALVTRPSPWYVINNMVPGARTLVTVEVPIRFQRELLSRFVPVYTTFGDLERELGVEVTGFRRSREFFGTVAIESRWPGFRSQDVIADDGYFTVWFRRWRGWARHESTPGLVAEIRKDEILVAPGDVVLVNVYDRKRATDDQTVR